MLWSLSPFQEMENLRKQMNDVFRSQTEVQRPAVNVYDAETGLTILAEVPGYTKEELDIQWERGVLTLSGSPEVVDSEPASERLRTEIKRPAFEKRLHVSGEFDIDSLTASLEDGLLSIHLPRAGKAQPRSIEIQ